MAKACGSRRVVVEIHPKSGECEVVRLLHEMMVESGVCARLNADWEMETVYETTFEHRLWQLCVNGVTEVSIYGSEKKVRECFFQCLQLNREKRLGLRIHF